jgi:ABC-type polysaccharide transport system permease subunit
MSKARSFNALRPMEYVGLAGVVALFAGAIFLMVTRNLIIASVIVGGVFVVVVIGLAMMVLAMSPNKKPEGEWDKPETGND